MPGMYAQVKFSLAPVDAMWLVPATTLLARSSGPQVVDVRRDGTVHYRASSAATLEIRSRSSPGSAAASDSS